jgi:2-iminobutanoate/2-iminopropanoate deaminase
MKFIQTNQAPAAIGPYSQAVCFENMLFVSGQLGIDPQSGKLADGIVQQTRQALNNLNQILIEAEMNCQNVIKTTLFLQHMEDFQVVNAVYAEFFKEHRPARSTVEVAALPKSALIEIEAVSVK